MCRSFASSSAGSVARRAASVRAVSPNAGTVVRGTGQTGTSDMVLAQEMSSCMAVRVSGDRAGDAERLDARGEAL